MPEELHQPQAQGGRVPVEHHRRVRADPRALHQPLQRGGAHGAVSGVLHVGVNVPEHGAVDVPVVVGGRADVHLDHPHIWVVEVPGQPDGIDQHALVGTWPCSGCSLLCCCLHLTLLVSVSSGTVLRRSHCHDVAPTLAKPWRTRAGPDWPPALCAGGCEPGPGRGTMAGSSGTATIWERHRDHLAERTDRDAVQGHRRADRPVRAERGPRRSRAAAEPVAREPAGVRTGVVAAGLPRPPGGSRSARIRPFSARRRAAVPAGDGRVRRSRRRSLRAGAPACRRPRHRHRGRAVRRRRSSGPAAQPGRRQRRRGRPAAARRPAEGLGRGTGPG